ncbi:MAG: hypothetical protein VXW37_00955 [Candidatus Thermoplasmatota archaeon]|jgi:hypothetical protein|nr:hypothetical protein [Candidatus Thermoplasmatota archaeon]
MSEGSRTDTSHLYDGKSVRSSAPSRKKAAGRVTQSTSIPRDAIPETKIPTWVESFFGGPLVPSVRFLSPNKTVVRLQMASVTTLILLGLVTFVITPSSGTVWFWLSNLVGVPFFSGLIHYLLLIGGVLIGAYGVIQRDQRMILLSQVAMILITVRFAGSKVEFAMAALDVDSEFIQKLLLIFYALFLVMYIELSSGVIRFSMLDTSIRTREVYVMGQDRIIQKYNRSLGTTPLIAGFVALITLLINVIIPAIIGIFDQVSSNRLSESVELTSVYGVALGTAMVFGLIAISFSVNLPARIQKFQEGRAE